MFRQFIGEVADVITPALGPGQHSGFLDICRRYLGKPRQSASLLRCYLESLEASDHRSGSSLQHENGFTKISLWKFDDESQVRIHIWPTGEFVDSRIHSHRWNFSSYVVCGELTAQNYLLNEVLHGQVGVDVFRLSDALDGKKTATWSQKAAVDESCIYTISAGSGHFLNFQTPHRVRKPANVPTISLMLSGPPLANDSLVVEGSSFDPERRTFLSHQAIANALAPALAGQV